MKFKSLKLSWFRGAAAEVTLLANKQKSLVVYGETGAGKSSFVDGIEYILNQGRINHLAHEHSGRRQEKALINTHAPEGEVGMVEVVLEDGSDISAIIRRDGVFSITPESNEISKWGYQRSILRQDEVANFIADTKGGKYSSLLPLLGLQHLEVSAENLRQLGKVILEQSELSAKRAEVGQVEQKRKEAFGNGDQGEESFSDELLRLYNLYCGKKKSIPEENLPEAIGEILEALDKKVDDLSYEEKKHTVLLEIAQSTLKDGISNVRSSTSELSKLTEPLVTEKLNILREAALFSEQLDPKSKISCPACGSKISAKLFKDHVKSEEKRLKEVADVFNVHRNNIRLLAEALFSLKQIYNKPEIKAWREKCKKSDIEHLSSIDIEAIRSSCSEKELKELETHIIPLIESAANESKGAPQKIQALLKDKETAQLIKNIVESKDVLDYIKEVDILISFVNGLQNIFRERIRAQSSAAISTISGDIARMWTMLHPNEQVEDVNLYLPAETDKAIEIGLKFYGIEQPSPRLTLSEGHRNSLGLCIFLAMAKHNPNPDTPIFLDDVVISFDRNHRGMIAELLEKEFKKRQIILFTHDREWFIELKLQLDAGSWEFRALMPWVDPGTGIRWSAKDSTFDDARIFLEADPSAAGNAARKIMDISLALIAEKLKIRLPYLHRERNDHRVVHDFLEQIISDSDVCLEEKVNDKYQPNVEAVSVLRNANKLLISWANRASHDFNLVKNEAEKLIVACEAALDVFACSSCGKMVFKSEDSNSKVLQCECGKLRWRYGKA